MINEGYKPDFEPSGDADRVVELKTGQWINVWKIPGLFNNEAVIQDIIAFRRFQRLGWPLGPWGIHPAPDVELIEAMLVVDEKYHPRTIL